MSVNFVEGLGAAPLKKKQVSRIVHIYDLYENEVFRSISARVVAQEAKLLKGSVS